MLVFSVSCEEVVYTFYTVLKGGGDEVMWRTYTRVIHCVFYQIPNLQNCFTTPNKTKEGSVLRHLPPSPFTDKFLRKADIWGLVSL
jgi:hypothetical protein